LYIYVTVDLLVIIYGVVVVELCTLRFVKYIKMKTKLTLADKV